MLISALDNVALNAAISTSGAGMTKIRTLVVDDEPVARAHVVSLLRGEQDIDVVGECATVDEGISVLKGTSVDVVLLDIDLGFQQGGAFLPLARAEGFQVDSVRVGPASVRNHAPGQGHVLAPHDMQRRQHQCRPRRLAEQHGAGRGNTAIEQALAGQVDCH